MAESGPCAHGLIHFLSSVIIAVLPLPLHCAQPVLRSTASSCDFAWYALEILISFHAFLVEFVVVASWLLIALFHVKLVNLSVFGRPSSRGFAAAGQNYPNPTAHHSIATQTKLRANDPESSL